MYLREKRIRVLKGVHVVLAVLGVFCVTASVYVIVSLFSYYYDDLKTVLEARAFPDVVRGSIVGALFLAAAWILKRLIGDANFYSGYFEGDLSGYVKYGDLAEVTGKSERQVKLQLHLFRRSCMKGYELQTVDRVEQVVLDSKVCICECQHCGASIEKRIYFTGICPYCGSSDLFARVLTGSRFYRIENRMSEGVKKPDFYLIKNIEGKKRLFLVGLCLGLLAVCLGLIICLGNIADYNNQDYLTEVLLSGRSHYASYALIKAEIRDLIIWGAVFSLAFVPAVVSQYKKLKYISVADTCAQYFSLSKTPFVPVKSLAAGNKWNKKRMKSVRGALRRRYLLNCTLEKHGGALQVALAKKIVKDICPSCGGAIVGAVDEHYRCRYCGNIIMGVIHKK